MSGQVLAFNLEFKHAADCITCSVPIIMPADTERALRRSHETYYCINGHPQYWPGKSDVEKLRDAVAEKERQLAFERERAAQNFAAREKAEKAVQRLKKRATGGACPCCNRTFVALSRHMKTKHPGFVKEGTDGQ